MAIQIKSMNELQIPKYLPDAPTNLDIKDQKHLELSYLLTLHVKSLTDYNRQSVGCVKPDDLL
jgi:hypothetical protein